MHTEHSLLLTTVFPTIVQTFMIVTTSMSAKNIQDDVRCFWKQHHNKLKEETWDEDEVWDQQVDHYSVCHSTPTLLLTLSSWRQSEACRWNVWITGRSTYQRGHEVMGFEQVVKDLDYIIKEEFLLRGSATSSHTWKLLNHCFFKKIQLSRFRAEHPSTCGGKQWIGEPGQT